MNIVLIGAVDSTRVALECLTEYGTPPSALRDAPAQPLEQALRLR